MENISQNLSYIQSKYYITSRTNKHGIITDASKAFCEISGYSITELIGSSHNIVRHPNMPDTVFKDMWKTIQGGKIWTGIVKNKAKDGTTYYVDTAIEPIYENNEIIGYLSVRFDVTEKFLLKKRNKDLDSSLKRFETLFNTMNAGLLILDRNGNIQDSNPYAHMVFDYEKEDILNKNYSVLFADENISEITNEFSNILSGNINRHKIVKKGKCKNGNEIWFELTFCAYDRNEILLSIKNIEAYKKLENVSKLLIRQSKDAAMGEMLAMISHQWRQPLTTISTILSKVKVHRELDIYDDSMLEKDFDKINSIVQHLSKTIEFFRNYFKPKNGHKDRLSNIVQGLSTIIEPLAKRTQINVNCSLNEIGELRVDNRIDQVLLNLIKNSMDAYEDKELEQKDIDVSFEIKENKLEIYICDYAGGIPEDILERIFEPYFSTKSKNGTGLGLYMSKNIIEDILQGQIYLKNGENGVCFTIVIPYEKRDNDVK